MSHIADEITDKKLLDSGSFRYILIISTVVIAAFFIGDTLFGKNSLEVYMALQKDKEIFAKKIDDIQHENAILQKQYFELKSLLPKELK